MKWHALFFGVALASALLIVAAAQGADCRKQLMQCIRSVESVDDDVESVTLLVRGMMKSRSGAT